MHLKSNISMVNALIRITIGLTVISWSTAKLVKRPWRDSYILMALLGAMKVAEGIVRFCPVTYLYERYQPKCPVPNGAEASRDAMEGLSTIEVEQTFPDNATE